MNLDDLKEIKESIFKTMSIPKEFLDREVDFSICANCKDCQHYRHQKDIYYFGVLCKLRFDGHGCPLHKLREIW